MKIDSDDWFDRKNKGYAQIEERLYFLEKAVLTKDERVYEVSVIEKLVGMMPNSQGRITYLNKLRNIDVDGK